MPFAPAPRTWIVGFGKCVDTYIGMRLFLYTNRIDVKHVCLVAQRFFDRGKEKQLYPQFGLLRKELVSIYVSFHRSSDDYKYT